MRKAGFEPAGNMGLSHARVPLSPLPQAGCRSRSFTWRCLSHEPSEPVLAPYLHKSAEGESNSRISGFAVQRLNRLGYPRNKRLKGIEPSYPDRQPGALPLSYNRVEPSYPDRQPEESVPGALPVSYNRVGASTMMRKMGFEPIITRF